MARFRRRDLKPSPYTSSCRFREWWISRWGNWSTRPDGVGSFTGFEEMTDQVNPGYFRAEREGTLKPVAPMSRIRQEDIVMPGGGMIEVQTNPDQKYQVEVGGYFYPSDREMPQPVNMPEPPSGAVLQRALARAQTDAWDALTFTAEFRSTVETVIGLRKRAISVVDRLSQRVASRAKRTAKATDIAKIVSEVWLELRYAWRPLLYDMADIEEAIGRMQAGIEDPLHRAYETENSSARETSNFVQTSVKLAGSSTLGLPGCVISQRSISTVEVKLHASVGLQVRTREVTMTDPFVTAWELVPFSFVLDWFVTIGDILAAFSPFATGELRYATLGVTTTQIETASNLIVPQPGMKLVSSSMSACTRTRTTTSYVRRLASPQPTLALQVDLSAFKILDLVALWLTQNASLTKRILRHF